MTFGVLLLSAGVTEIQRPTRLLAQTPSTGDVISSSGVISPIVVNYDRTVQFYHELLGLDAPAPHEASAKDAPPPPLLKLQGLPDSRMRWSHVTFPGTLWWAEPLEYGDVDRQAAAPRLQDPGAATIIFLVRDLDAIAARVSKTGTPIVTPGSSPVLTTMGASHGRALLVRDPDGHFLELVQASAIPEGSPAGDVVGAGIRLTIGDTTKTADLYRDLGFQPKVGSFVNDAGYAALTGLNGAEFRLTTAQVPGQPRLIFEFVEFRGIDRRPVRARIQDPGSMKFQFVVRNLDSAAAKFVGAGGAVVSTGGAPVTLGAAGPHLIVRDLNNFYFILQQQPVPKP
jgi:predicted enzyme related to lactoylglutathione lyase